MVLIASPNIDASAQVNAKRSGFVTIKTHVPWLIYCAVGNL